MKNLFSLSVLLFAVINLWADGGFLWQCNDGGKPRMIKCTGMPQFDARISNQKKASFQNVDGRTVLRLDGTSAYVGHASELDMTGGFILEATFKPDFKAIQNWKWMGLISKGKNYSSGYALMFNPQGAILLTLKTDAEMLWFQTKAGAVKDGVEQTIAVAVNNGLAKIYVNGKLFAQRKYKGKLADAGHPFYIGSGYYGYYGTVRDVKLNKYSADALPENRELAAAGRIHEWKCDDGTGSQTVKCSSTALLNGKILSAKKSRWAQADERGFFLRLDGTSVEIPWQENLDYPDGFILETEFAVDFKASPQSKWFGLLSTGKNYSSGYAVLINPNGSLLFTLLTEKDNCWFQTKAGFIKNNRDTKLQIYVGDGMAKIFVDGKLIFQRKYYGKPVNKALPLYLGATYYPFFGNIYNLKLQPYDKKLVPAGEIAKEKPKPVFVPEPVVDPAGTVTVSDFSVLSPAPETGFSSDPRFWSFGKAFKTGPVGTLYPPGIDSGTISYKSTLKGKYDFYLCGRLISAATCLQLTIGNDPEAYFVNGKAQAEFNAVHRNYEVCVARDLDMDGLEIKFYPGGIYYLGYLKFIPVANRRPKENTPDPDVTVTRGKVEKISPDKGIVANAHLFTERKYVDERPAPAVSEISQKRGFQIFNHPWMSLLFLNSNASSDTGKAELKIAAAPGEYEPATLGIRGLRNVGNVQLKMTKPFGTSKISAEIAVVESIPKRSTNYHGKSEYMLGPQYLEKSSSVTVQKGVTRQFWITFHIPQGTEPGIYKGEFELISAAGKVAVPAEVKVYPFNLESPGVSYGMWVTEFNAKNVREDFDAMGKHGINWVCMHSDKAVKFDDMHVDTMKIDLENSLFSVAAETLQKYGPVTLITMYDDVLKFVAHYNKGREFEAVHKAQQIISDYCKKRNFPEIYWLGDDEILSHPARIEACIPRLEMHKKAGMRVGTNHLWKKTVRPQHEAAEKLEKLSDIIIIRYNTQTLYYVDTWKEILRECLAAGKPLLSYNNDCCLVFAQPAGKRFAHGWFLRSIGKGSAGMGWYMYLGINGSPYTDLDGTADWCYTYPAAEGRNGGVSIDFEALREGTDDMRYIRTLEKSIADAKKRNINTFEAEKLLNDLENSIDQKRFNNNSLFINSVWDKTFEKEEQRFASGEYLPPTGWRVADYEKAREKVAEAIIKLQEKMR